MNSLDLLLLGTFGLSLTSYCLGRFHGARKVRKSTAKFIKSLQPFKEFN